MSLTFDDLRKANTNRQKEWETSSKLDLSYLGNAAAGEMGETCNVIKKLERERLGLTGSRATKRELADELADTLIYLDLIANRAGINLGEAVRKKYNDTSAKYGFEERL